MFASRSLLAALPFARALDVAHPLHKGRCVYHSKADTVAVLRAVEEERPDWWCDEATQFIARVEKAHFVLPEKLAHPVVVVEGLDGVGKSTVTENLAARLGALLLRTPDPSLSDLRPMFRVLPEPLSRAFYSAANYLAAEAAVAEQAARAVVIDRWWPSTCAMALAAEGKLAALPKESDAVYRWPADLPRFTLGVLLDVDEDIRLKRMKKRGDENKEEAVLAASREMRAAATAAYLRIGGQGEGGLLRLVKVPNWPRAVNSILDMLEAAPLPNKKEGQFAKLKCTQEEIDAVSPY